MKKLKIFITIFASLLLILLFNNISYASDYNGVSGLNEFIKQNAGASMIGKTISISHSDLENSKYVYCVAYHKRFRQTVEFKVQHYVELEGEIARIPSLGIDNVKNTYNIILSEILSGKYGTGYGKLENYSDAQIALYAYFNPWLDEGKFWYNGGVRTMREVCGLDSTWGTKPTNAPDEWDIPNSIISEIYDVAGGRSSLDTGEGREKVYKYYNQKVRLYFIDVVGAVNHQKLLIAIPAPIEIRMNVYKIDKNTRQPLANVGFQVKNSKGQYLFYNEGTSKIEYVDEANAGTFYSDSNGYVRISGVNADTYEFIETEPIANYETSKGKSITVVIKSGEYKKTVTFENEKKNGSKEIIVEKVWNDNDDYFKKRPKSIEVQLIQNGKIYKKGTITPQNYKENKWTYTFKDLPEFDENGEEYTYAVLETETSEIDGYKPIIKEAETNKKFIITNNYLHANIDIEVIKKWYDSNSGNRPGSVTVKLLADKEEIDSAKLSSNNNWQHTFKDLPAVKKNIHVEYSVYAGTFDDVSSVKITLYKYDKNKKENIKVDSQSDYGEYGSVEFLHLPVYENGEEIEYIIKGSAYIEEDGSWFGGGRKYWKTLSDYELDITEEEKAVEYDIKEINVPGYTSSIDISDDGKKYTILNIADGEGNVTISGKVWLDIPDGKANENNGKYDSKDELLENVIVHWKDKNGNDIASTVTDSDGNYVMKAKIDIRFCTYKVNSTQYNRLNNSYVEFEYNGLKYTTVASESSGADTSKAIEDAASRTDLDKSFDEVNKKGVLDNGTLYRTRYMGRHTADLEYDYADHKSTLRQENADFQVFASTKNVINTLLDVGGYTETTRGLGEYCYYHCPGWPADGDEPAHASHHNLGSRLNSWNIKNVNLGLVLREQPDMAITSDIDHVTVIMKNQEYTYYYKGRATAPSDELFDYKVKFSGKYTQEYKRPINPSDISYINYDGNNPEDLQVYVTYNVKVTNQSKTLPIKVQEIVNYYDAKYDGDYVEKADNGWAHSSKYKDRYDDGTYRAIYNQELANEIIRPGGTKTIQLKHKVETETVKSLIKGEDILIKSVFEIYSYSSYYGEDTLYAEDQKAGNLGISGMQNSGVDLDSAPGSAKMQLVQGQNGKPELDTYSFEDDTDMAPTFVLCEDPNYKIITGTVYEDTKDTSVSKEGERLGNGTKDSNEYGIEGVQVQLLKLNNDGTVEPAYLYKIGTSPASEATAERRLAVTWTNSDGDYSFGESGTEGVVVDNYVIKYTYGNGTTTEISGEANGTTETVGSRQLQSKINGNVINARNYKSTIIRTDPVQDVMKRNISGTNITIEDLKWHLTEQDDASIAVDDIDNLHWKFVNDNGQLVDVDIVSGNEDNEARLRIDSLKYSNFDDGKNVSAYSLPLKVQIEYDTKTQDSTLKQEQGSKGEINIGGLEFVGEGEIASGDLTNGKDYENNWSKFDFGIIERPRENIVIDKTIQNIKITLANGQVLTEGNPYEKKLNYVKAMGTKNVTTRERSIDAHDKLLYIEMDSELIQGARLDILYAITVTNNSEIDYEYEEALGGNEKYYYYGERASDPIKPSVELVVDYMDPELSCTVGAGTEYNENWQQVQADTDLHDNGYISDKTYNTVKREAGNYLIFVTSVFKDLARGESHTENLFASKLLANQATEYTYENHVEILQLNGKIARNKDSVEENTREQITKQYKPGTYIPDLKRINVGSSAYSAGVNNSGYTGWGTVDGTIEYPGFHTQDDDMITIRITPPTGLENNMIIYISVGVVGLIVIAVGIYFIKKKVIG